MGTSTIDIISDTGKEAQIVLDWDDNIFYISNITSASSESASINSTENTIDTSSGVKVAVWNSDYKYATSDIIGNKGILYVSMQEHNKGNLPSDGTFWWKPVVDLSNLNAVTLEGRNYEEMSKDILGGNVISDYYKISETQSLILKYVNNINAKQLDGWSLQNIKDDYISVIAMVESNSNAFAIDYFTSEDMNSYQQGLVDEFSTEILADNINQFKE